MGDKKKKKVRKERIYVPYQKEDKGPSWVGIIVLCLIQLWPIAAIVLVKKLSCMWKNKKMTDYRNYAAIIGNRVEVDIRELSAKLGKTTSLVAGDLQAMIEKGYISGDAYVDRSRGVLVLDPLATEFVEEEEAEAEPEVKAEPIHPVQEKVREERVKFVRPERPVYEINLEQEKKPTVESNVWMDDEYETYLRQIRALNDQIDDEEVSRRIDRIGELSASIFRVVREKPDRADDVKKFLSYYLPTTFKLLKSYALMEKQSFQGENIVASRKKIEDILDSLITAFEQQQDRLFRTEALDVEADIEVLETMLAKDGLVTPKGADIRSVMGGR